MGIRYSKIENKNKREIVLLKSFPCKYGKCKFCNYIEDNSTDEELNNNYEEKIVTEFKGVYSGQLPINEEKDEIKILTNNVLKNCTVYNYEKNEATTIYNFDKMNSLDKYDIYLSGAVSLISIENTENKTGRELVVFRDSFASSFVPLLVEGYDKITLIDTRYISPKILENYIEFSNQDILFLYSTSVINNSYSLK